MTIQDILNVNQHLEMGENKFTLWPVSEYNDKPILTLTSKYGFRRFIVTPEMDLKEAQERAIKIDKDLCSIPLPEYCKKCIGLEFITLH